MAEYNYSFNILLIGDSFTGKSSILNRYTEDTFTESYLSTSINYKNKRIRIKNSQVRLRMWDMSGQERFSAERYYCYNRACAFLIVFDKTNRKSFENLETWVEKIRCLAPPDVTFIFVGNKCDFEPQVSTEEVQEKALRYQVPYIDVSSKTNEKIEILFEILTRKLIDMQKANQKRKNDC